MKTTIQLTFLFFLLFAMGCENGSDPEKKDPVDPSVKSCENSKSTHEFTWRVDTIGYSVSNVAGIWAFSDSDVYVIGNLTISRPNDPNPKGSLGLHWDGKTWSKNIYGTWLEIGNDPESLTGDKSELVVVGDGFGYNVPAIGEFNNATKKWKTTQFTDDGIFLSAWTDGTGYFLAGGTNGILYERKNRSSGWTKINGPLNGNIFSLTGVSSKLFFAFMYAPFSNNEEVWMSKNGKWTQIYSTENPDLKTALPGTKGTRIHHIDGFFCDVTKVFTLYTTSTPFQVFELKEADSLFTKVSIPFTSQVPTYWQAIMVIKPNDLWVHGNYLFHWDGKTVKEIVIPGYPGYAKSRQVAQTTTGKVFLPLYKNEGGPWIMAIGTPGN